MIWIIVIVFFVWIGIILSGGEKDKRFKTGYRDNDSGPGLGFKLKWTVILWGIMYLLALLFIK